eukprot:1452664-Rhodomonas_salina.1
MILNSASRYQTATPRNPTQETAISVPFAPGMRFLASDFGACAGSDTASRASKQRGHQRQQTRQSLPPASPPHRIFAPLRDARMSMRRI